MVLYIKIHAFATPIAVLAESFAKNYAVCRKKIMRSAFLTYNAVYNILKAQRQYRDKEISS